MEVKSIDKSNMRAVILSFPKQFKIGLRAAQGVKVEGRFDALTICGMGGSALPADILTIWLNAQKIALPVYINRNYGLPFQTDQRHLVVCISYSGNTEETLDCFEGARQKKLKIVTVSSGGKLAEIAKKYGIASVIVPGGLEPRMALGLQFATLMQILANCQIIEGGLKSVSALEKLLQPQNLENEGKVLAKKLKGEIPVIYASDKFKSLARIWKIQFNENSKTPAFSNHFPELNHNEQNQFAGDKNNQLSIIMLRDAEDHPRVLKRMELLAQMLREMKVSIDIIDIEGKDILDKTFSSILLGDWTSYHLALLNKVDPTPVKIIEEFKKKLAQQ